MGCEFCNNQDNAIDGIYQNDEGDYILKLYGGWDDYLDDFDYEEIKVNFCPICGRKLYYVLEVVIL